MAFTMLLKDDLGDVPTVFGLNFAHCPMDLNSYLFLAGLKGVRRDISDGSNFDIFRFLPKRGEAILNFTIQIFKYTIKYIFSNFKVLMRSIYCCEDE
jgi:hypothetical protein